MQEHLRRIEQAASPAPAAPAPTPSAPRPVAPEATARIQVNEIQFSRSELLAPQALQAVAQGYVGKPLGTSDIQQLLDDIAGLYRAQGILTALPVLPPQDLKSGQMRILLVEGRLGEIRVQAPDAVDASWVQRWFDLPPHAVVRSEALRERLARFNNASDFAAQAEFVAGGQFGVSDLAIEIQPLEQVHGWAFHESVTARGLPTHRLAGAGLRVVPVTRQGGRLDAAVLDADTSRTVTASFGLPLGTEGWRAGVAGTGSRSRSDLPEQGLRVRGKSSAITGEINRAWILADPMLLTTGISLGRHQTSSRYYIDPTPEPVETGHANNKLALTANLQHESGRARGALRAGFNANLNEASYSYWELAGNWLAPFDQEGRWLWRVGGVWRSAPRGPLGTMDQFQLGGSDTVRGFDAGAGAGDRGRAVQLELRHRPADAGWGQLESYAFTDAGVASGATSRKHLRSAGLGAQARMANGLGVELMASRQLGTSQGARNRLLLRFAFGW